jgi:hypothetical protein
VVRAVRVEAEVTPRAITRRLAEVAAVAGRIAGF